MRFQAGLAALIYLLIGIVTYNASVALEPQLGEPTRGNFAEPQAEPDSYPYPQSSFFEQEKPSRRLPAGFRSEWIAAESLDLPNDLYEYSIGLAWVRSINDRWTVRTMLGVGFATDNQNTSRDAWQFRGGVFAMYKRDEQLTGTFGALATGRDDLPVIPAVGAVWQPNPYTRVDLLFPQPKVNRLIFDDGSRQQWAFFGFGINGKTWAYERAGMIDDRLTY